MFNSHWDNEGALARLHSAGMIAQRVIAAKDDIPAIVTGDFNCTPGSAPVRYLLGDNPAIAGLEGRYPASPGLRDVYAIAGPKEAHDGTFHGFSGVPDGERIDYILATPEIEPVDCRIVRSGAAGRFPSDHFPVVARLRW
jgi:endonuclease/exonuclease/phosphatase family metal-dependent hydrolase